MASTVVVTSWGSGFIGRRPLRVRPSSRMWMRSEVQLATPPIGSVGVELGGREVGMAEHLLDAAEVGAALEQVGGERVAQQMRVDALGLQAGFLGQPAEDEEGTGPRERPAARIQEELRAVAPVEVRPADGDVAAEGVDGRTAERHDPLL